MARRGSVPTTSKQRRATYRRLVSDAAGGVEAAHSLVAGARARVAAAGHWQSRREEARLHCRMTKAEFAETRVGRLALSADTAEYHALNAEELHGELHRQLGEYVTEEHYQNVADELRPPLDLRYEQYLRACDEGNIVKVNARYLGVARKQLGGGGMRTDNHNKATRAANDILFAHGINYSIGSGNAGAWQLTTRADYYYATREFLKARGYGVKFCHVNAPYASPYPESRDARMATSEVAARVAQYGCTCLFAKCTHRHRFDPDNWTPYTTYGGVNVGMCLTREDVATFVEGDVFIEARYVPRLLGHYVGNDYRESGDPSRGPGRLDIERIYAGDIKFRACDGFEDYSAIGHEDNLPVVGAPTWHGRSVTVTRLAFATRDLREFGDWEVIHVEIGGDPLAGAIAPGRGGLAPASDVDVCVAQGFDYLPSSDGECLITACLLATGTQADPATLRRVLAMHGSRPEWAQPGFPLCRAALDVLARILDRRFHVLHVEAGRLSTLYVVGNGDDAYLLYSIPVGSTRHDVGHYDGLAVRVAVPESHAPVVDASSTGPPSDSAPTLAAALRSGEYIAHDLSLYSSDSQVALAAEMTLFADFCVLLGKLTTSKTSVVDDVAKQIEHDVLATVRACNTADYPRYRARVDYLTLLIPGLLADVAALRQRTHSAVVHEGRIASVLASTRNGSGRGACATAVADLALADGTTRVKERMADALLALPPPSAAFVAGAFVGPTALTAYAANKAARALVPTRVSGIVACAVALGAVVVGAAAASSVFRQWVWSAKWLAAWRYGPTRPRFALDRTDACPPSTDGTTLTHGPRRAIDPTRSELVHSGLFLPQPTCADPVAVTSSTAYTPGTFVLSPPLGNARHCPDTSPTPSSPRIATCSPPPGTNGLPSGQLQNETLFSPVSVMSGGAAAVSNPALNANACISGPRVRASFKPIRISPHNASLPSSTSLSRKPYALSPIPRRTPAVTSCSQESESPRLQAGPPPSSPNGLTLTQAAPFTSATENVGTQPCSERIMLLNGRSWSDVTPGSPQASAPIIRVAESSTAHTVTSITEPMAPSSLDTTTRPVAIPSSISRSPRALCATVAIRARSLPSATTYSLP
nr:MAG: hypothetical protein [Owegonang virus 4]